MKRVLVIFFAFFVTSCKGSQEIYLNGEKYCIPEEYLISEPSYLDGVDGGLDFNAGIVALSFSMTDDLGLSYNGNADVLVALFSRDVVKADVSGDSSSFNSSHMYDVGDRYRLFSEGVDHEWRVVPKAGTSFSPDKSSGTSPWIASCFLSGVSVLDPELSRTSANIKSACKVSVLNQNYLIRVSAEERNFLENHSSIVDGINFRISSWRCEDGQN